MVDIKFAYWVPNVSGGLVVSKIPQNTDWTYDYNVWLAAFGRDVIPLIRQLDSRRRAEDLLAV